MKLQNIRISYGEVEVIKGISVELKEGELTCILGLNGSGKSTLLHGICGLIPMEGTITWAGGNIGGMSVKERARIISFIPQVTTIMGSRKVEDVVLMGRNPHLGFLQGYGEEDYKNAWRILESIDMADFLHRDFQELSEGQKQMIILARCLMQDTPVMVMDEPDSALDFTNRRKILQNIRGVIHNLGRTGLITLHDSNSAMKYCDRLLLLKNGTIAGDISMKDADQKTLEDGLKIIYGEIKLALVNGSFIMN